MAVLFSPIMITGGAAGAGEDLWQDCLALLLMENKNVRQLLYNNFAGVRIDGSNATIIGDQPENLLLIVIIYPDLDGPWSMAFIDHKSLY